MGSGHTYLTIISKTAHATSSVHIFYWYFNCIFWLPDESESLHVVWFSGLVKCLCDKQVFFSELCEFSVATQFVCSVSGAVRGSSIWICKHGMQPSLELKMESFWPPWVWNISVVKILSLATLPFVPARQLISHCMDLYVSTKFLCFWLFQRAGVDAWCFENLVLGCKYLLLILNLLISFIRSNCWQLLVLHGNRCSSFAADSAK